MSLELEIINDRERFDAIRLTWQLLWKRSGAFIFQEHSWIAGWLTAVSNRRDIRLQIAVAWNGETLVGAIPCAIHRRSGLRVLSWAAQLFSDYCDCLVDIAWQWTDVLPPLWDQLLAAGGFDLVVLQNLRPDARCRAFLDKLANEGSRLHLRERSERCMRIENRWPNGQSFFRSLNKKARNNHTRGKRILAEMGGEVIFRCVEPTTDATSLFDEILRLKMIWLRANDPSSILLGRDGNVLRAVLDKAWEAGLAKIFLLECGGKVAAASVNFVYAGHMEAYLTAYDASFSRASPGTILIVEYAQWSFDRGLAYVDFLRGEEAFKFRMANAETILSSFSGARTLLGQVAISGHRLFSKRRQRQGGVNESPDDQPPVSVKLPPT
jgi:CelD/BcsL family acetyltransferase involved in cellulose biosynthesis